jgi:hypothetical protein
MAQEIETPVAEVETPVEPEAPKEFGEMGVDERVEYVRNLREQAGVPVAEKPVEKVRNEKGQFASTKQEETPVEDDAHSALADAGKTVEADEPKPEAEEPADWRDAEVLGLAASYGIDEKKLAKIPSREVLDVLLDSLEVMPEEKPVERIEKPVKQPEKKSEADLKSEAEEFSLANNDELAADDAPTLVAKIREQDRIIRELREFQEQQRLSVGQQWLQSAQSRVAESAQKTYPDFYGEPGKTPTKEQAARLSELWQEHCDRAIRVEKRGGKPDEGPGFVKRSIASAHGDLILSEIEKKQERLNKLVAQANRKTGGGSTKSLPTAGASPLEKNLARLPQTLRALGVAGT